MSDTRSSDYLLVVFCHLCYSHLNYFLYIDYLYIEMPRKPKTRQMVRKRRKYFKKSPLGRQLGQIVADRQIVTVTYGTLINIESFVGTAGTYQFRANSIYDPDFSGAGHQPLGHDQWLAFYQSYFVMSSVCRVDFIPPNTSSVQSNFLGAIRVSGDASPSSVTTTQLLENRSAVSKPVTIGKGSTRIVAKYSARKLYNKLSEIGSTLGAKFGANPAEDVYFQCSIAPFNSGYAAISDLSVQITYTVMLFEPKSLSQS